MCHYNDKKIVVAIPCHNEEQTIEKVIKDFKKEIPNADIVVVNNCSSDKSVQLAKGAGASVINEKKLGKGCAIRAIFERLDADIYIIVDGDDTYLAADVHRLIAPILDERADMVVGSRLDTSEPGAFRPLHVLGNYLFTFLLNKLFRANFTDILSGYRVLSNEFVNRVPLISSGFQTETEMTIQAIEKRMDIIEVPVNYKARSAGSSSKIHTFRDGWLILLTMAMYMRDHNPLRFFLYLSIFWIGCNELLFVAGFLAKFNKIEMVIVQVIIILGALLLLVGGMVMSAVNTRFKELEEILRKLIKNGNLAKKL